ncbi:unnamed protein product [Gadus morhua 'NCC']
MSGDDLNAFPRDGPVGKRREARCRESSSGGLEDTEDPQPPRFRGVMMGSGAWRIPQTPAPPLVPPPRISEQRHLHHHLHHPPLPQSDGTSTTTSTTRHYHKVMEPPPPPPPPATTTK